MALDTRIQLSKLEIFCRVVELGSMSRAAKEQFVSQPVVTAHVRALQDRLGKAPLLYRDGNRMRPTEAGQVAYNWAKDVLTRSQEMSRRIEGLADGSRGSVVIAASMTVGSYMLPPLLTRFRAAHPLAKITVGMSDPEHVIDAVETGGCDLGVLIADDDSLRGHVVFEQVGEEEFVLVAAPDAEIPDAIPSSRLAQLSFVAAPHDLVREQLVTRMLDARGIEQGPIALELGHAEAMKRAVRDGVGAAFLYLTSVQDELARNALRRIKIRGLSRLPAPIFLAYRDAKNFSPIQQSLLDVIREELA